MRRWKAVTTAAVIFCAGLSAQEYDHFAAISEFTGCTSAEDIDQDEAERLERYIIRPLKINVDNVSRIRESGLLTHYQIVSLEDYRSRHGDVLSLMELSAVDGFGSEFVRRLQPFISLESSRAPGQGTFGRKRLRQELDLKGGLRSNKEFKSSYAFKYGIDAGESLQASIALSKSSDSKQPDALTGNLFWHFRAKPVKLGIGDFNARFGQGLALWNGMNLSGLSRPSSYLRRASGLSASHSFTGNYAFRGIAVESDFTRVRASVLTAVTDLQDKPGLLPAVNLTWMWRSGQAGLTHYVELRPQDFHSILADMKTSCDLALTVKGVDLFAETAYDWINKAAASLAGTVFPLGENIRMASMLRYYPSSYDPTYSAAARALTRCSNEYGASLSAEFLSGKWLSVNGLDGFGSSVRRIDGAFSCDAAYFPVSKSSDGVRSIQIKSLAELKVMITSKVAVRLRFSERFRTWESPFRTDVRMDVLYYSRYFDGTFRVNVLECEDIAFLTYAEGILKTQYAKLSLRTGLFRIDNWNDRIYAYERDIPGAFNIPAFYGRGYWASFTANWRFSRWGRLYVRASLTEYPFDDQKKPGKAELKFMLKIAI